MDQRDTRDNTQSEENDTEDDPKRQKGRVRERPHDEHGGEMKKCVKMEQPSTDETKVK